MGRLLQDVVAKKRQDSRRKSVNFEAFQHDTSSPSSKMSSHFSDESKFVTDTEGNNSPLIIYSATSIFEAITRRARVQYVGVASS